MRFIPVRVFPAFVHIPLIRAVGPLDSVVPRIPREVLVSEGPGKDRSGQASHSSKFLEVSVPLGRESVSLLPRYNKQVFYFLEASGTQSNGLYLSEG